MIFRASKNHPDTFSDLDLSPIRTLYPFESHFLDIDGHRMHYVDEGRGPVVLMLHGNPTWSFHYRELIRGLADQYRVIAPDHIGCGLSDKPQNYDYTLATHIANIDRLIDHLGLEDVTLMVHDWGGAIGFGVATRRPELFRRLVVCNTAAWLVRRIPMRIRVCRWPLIGPIAVRCFNAFARAALTMAVAKTRPRSPEPRASARASSPDVADAQQTENRHTQTEASVEPADQDSVAPACRRCDDKPSTPRRRLPKDVRAGYLLPYNSYANRVAILRFVRDIPTGPQHPSYAVLEKMDADLDQLRDKPMIIFWGARDFCFNEQFLDGWRHRFPDAQVHRFEDAGHYVIEDAGDRILPALRQFLEQ